MSEKFRSYMAIHIANFFLKKEREKIISLLGKKMTNLRLNKLVYLAYSWGLVTLEHEIFSEPIQAWQYGPVIPSIYHEFKAFHSKHIDQLATLYDDEKEVELIPLVEKDNFYILELLQAVYEKYGHYSARDLVLITHKEGSPWAQTFDGSYGKVIKNETIEKYYKNIIDQVLDND